MRFKHQPDLAERPSASKQFKAILLVDDDRELVQTMQWILADQNFLVDKAYDGKEALLKVRANEYDAIICDLMMPQLRGDQFFHQATLHRPWLAKRFVFVTGFSADPAMHHFLTRHGLTYFVKPVSVTELVKYVNELVA